MENPKPIEGQSALSGSESDNGSLAAGKSDADTKLKSGAREELRAEEKEPAEGLDGSADGKEEQQLKLQNQLSSSEQMLELNRSLVQSLFDDENARCQAFEQKASSMLGVAAVAITLMAALVALLFVTDNTLTTIWKDVGPLLLGAILLITRGVIAAMRTLHPRYYARLAKKDLLEIQSLPYDQALKTIVAKIIVFNEQNRKENRVKLNELDIAITCASSFFFLMILLTAAIYMTRVYAVTIPHDIAMVFGGAVIVFALFAEKIVITVARPTK